MKTAMKFPERFMKIATGFDMKIAMKYTGGID